MPKRPDLTVVLPARNEAAIIEARRSRLSVTTMLTSLGELLAFRVRTLPFVRAPEPERPWARPEQATATPWVG